MKTAMASPSTVAKETDRTDVFLLGLVIWLIFAACSYFNWLRLDLVELLFLLAPWTIVPAALTFAPALARHYPARVFRTQRWLTFSAAALCTSSFLRPAGLIAALLASCWFFACLCIAWGGVRRLFLFRTESFPQFCFAVGEGYIAVGGVWLMLSRAGLHPVGFQEPIVLLTAVHFHFAGFLSCIFAGLTYGRLQSTRWAHPLRIALLGTLFGPGVLGMAFLVNPKLKLIAVILIVIGQSGLAAGMARIGATSFLGTPTLLRPAGWAGRISRLAASNLLSGFLLMAASASVIAAMIYAATWALGEYPLQPMTDLSHMERIHGVLNAAGFGVLGTLGWIGFQIREPYLT